MEFLVTFSPVFLVQSCRISTFPLHSIIFIKTELLYFIVKFPIGWIQNEERKDAMTNKKENILHLLTVYTSKLNY